MTRLTDLTILAADNTDGAEWYPKAQAEIAAVCKAENWNVEYFTGILAVTSPRVSVRRNIRITLQYLESRKLMSNIIRSVRKSVDVYNDTREIKGRKTGPFYRALLGDDSAIVLDTHMANLFQIPQKLFALKHSYAYYSGLVKGVADTLRMGGAECQACLWYGHRRSLGEKPATFPILQEYQNWLSQGKRFPNSGSIDSVNGQKSFLDNVIEPAYDDVSFPFGAVA